MWTPTLTKRTKFNLHYIHLKILWKPGCNLSQTERIACSENFHQVKSCVWELILKMSEMVTLPHSWKIIHSKTDSVVVFVSALSSSEIGCQNYPLNVTIIIIKYYWVAEKKRTERLDDQITNKNRQCRCSSQVLCNIPVWWCPDVEAKSYSIYVVSLWTTTNQAQMKKYLVKTMG